MCVGGGGVPFFFFSLCGDVQTTITYLGKPSYTNATCVGNSLEITNDFAVS